MAEETLGTDPGIGESSQHTTFAGAACGPIGMIVGYNIEGGEKTELDITTLNNVSGWMTFIQALKDPKTIQLDLLFDPGNMNVLMTSFAETANDTYTATFPDGSTYVQAGFCKKVGVQGKMNEKITQSVVFRMSGPPEFNTASGLT